MHIKPNKEVNEGGYGLVAILEVKLRESEIMIGDE